MTCHIRFIPEEDEDGFPIRNSIQLVVVIQERLDAVNQARVHLVHLIEDKHGTCTVGDIAFDPLLQLGLNEDSWTFVRKPKEENSLSVLHFT